jgi:hypothetical protein
MKPFWQGGGETVWYALGSPIVLRDDVIRVSVVLGLGILEAQKLFGGVPTLPARGGKACRRSRSAAEV